LKLPPPPCAVLLVVVVVAVVVAAAAVVVVVVPGSAGQQPHFASLADRSLKSSISGFLSAHLVILANI